MSHKNRYTDRVKVGDYQIYCMVCGQVCWYSQSVVLGPYTGHEGQVVCPNHAYEPQYGLQPFVVEPEEAIPYAQPNQITYTQESTVTDFNPLSGNLPTE
jgi:hypothetical protein